MARQRHTRERGDAATHASACQKEAVTLTGQCAHVPREALMQLGQKEQVAATAAAHPLVGITVAPSDAETAVREFSAQETQCAVRTGLQLVKQWGAGGAGPQATGTVAQLNSEGKRVAVDHRKEREARHSNT